MSWSKNPDAPRPTSLSSSFCFSSFFRCWISRICASISACVVIANGGSCAVTGPSYSSTQPLARFRCGGSCPSAACPSPGLSDNTDIYKPANNSSKHETRANTIEYIFRYSTPLRPRRR